MAARRSTAGGDSKQGLVIALVLFVLLSILLATAAYFGYAGQSDLEQQRDKIAKDKATVDTERNKQLVQRAVLEAGIGAANEQTYKDLAGLRGPNKEDYEAAVKKLKGLTWDPAQEKPTNTYASQIEELQNQLANLKKERDKFEEAAANSKATYDKLRAAKDDELQKTKEALAAAQNQTKEAEAKKTKEYLDQVETNKKLAEENATLKQQSETDKQTLQKQIEKLKKELDQARLLVKKTEEKIAPVNVLAHEQPKARIVRLDRSGGTAYIDVGSADRVNPQLTFSIFSPGTFARPNAEPKGTVEVTRVLAEHLSEARVRDTRNPLRDPIVTGDQLFNPAWSPNLREHVAIAGFIDLTGDGRDSTVEFARSLERQGIVVDAYLDLKDRAIKGRGITMQTTYLVLGGMPRFEEGAAAVAEGSARADVKNDIQQKISEMEEQARRLGVTILPARRFMALVGYRLPRLTGETEWSSTYFRPSPKAPAKAEDEAEPEKKRDKEPVKKEDKEDKEKDN
jgi:hypothetical protein